MWEWDRHWILCQNEYSACSGLPWQAISARCLFVNMQNLTSPQSSCKANSIQLFLFYIMFAFSTHICSTHTRLLETLSWCYFYSSPLLWIIPFYLEGSIKTPLFSQFSSWSSPSWINLYKSVSEYCLWAQLYTLWVTKQCFHLAPTSHVYPKGGKPEWWIKCMAYRSTLCGEVGIQI